MLNKGVGFFGVGFLVWRWKAPNAWQEQHLSDRPASRSKGMCSFLHDWRWIWRWIRRWILFLRNCRFNMSFRGSERAALFVQQPAFSWP